MSENETLLAKTYAEHSRSDPSTYGRDLVVPPRVYASKALALSACEVAKRDCLSLSWFWNGIDEFGAVATNCALFLAV